MADVQLTLNDDEREYLVMLLETALKDTRIEEHRTRAPAYRAHVLHNEECLISLLRKLGHSPDS